MSQVAPFPSEDVELEPRAVSPAAKARIIKRDKHCTYPGCEIATGLEVDHIVALALGGKNADANLQALCGDHHKTKTAADAKAIAKAKRRFMKHRGTFPPAKQQIRSRGFDKRWRD